MTLTPASMQYHLWQGPRSPAHFRSARLRWILLSEQDANASFSFNFLNATFWECTLFKEWKSHANLHAFDTTNPHIAAGLIWASVCAAILKRYCAHMAQRFAHLPISTQRVAKCIQHVLRDIIHALMHCPIELNKVITLALEYLSKNAQRAHPKRDALSGRSKLGLVPVYEVA